MKKITEEDTKNRDLSVIKVCETCGRQYHPRRNGYQTTSKYCSALCARKKRPFSPV